MNLGPVFVPVFAWEQSPDVLFEHIHRVRRAGEALISATGTDPLARRLVSGAKTPQVATDTNICTFGGDEDAQYEAYDLPDLERWGREIERALHALEESSAHAASLVNMALVVLAVRADMKWQSPYSSSWRGKPGLAGVTNPHLADNAQAFLMNALVHEAIHSALYYYEEEAPFVRSGGPRATSEWTGASLRLESLVHAVFVWYGLFNLWSSPQGVRLDVDGRFRRRALTGFAKNPLRELNVHRDRLRDGLLDCLELLVQRVRIHSETFKLR